MVRKRIGSPCLLARRVIDLSRPSILHLTDGHALMLSRKTHRLVPRREFIIRKARAEQRRGPQPCTAP